VDYEKLSGDRVGEPSECIRARVQAARDIQLKRFSQNGSTDILCSDDGTARLLRDFTDEEPAQYGITDDAPACP
jgi:hypothetical protein